jgi:hypothetical protein
MCAGQPTPVSALLSNKLTSFANTFFALSSRCNPADVVSHVSVAKLCKLPGKELQLHQNNTVCVCVGGGGGERGQLA